MQKVIIASVRKHGGENNLYAYHDLREAREALPDLLIDFVSETIGVYEATVLLGNLQDADLDTGDQDVINDDQFGVIAEIQTVSYQDEPENNGDEDGAERHILGNSSICGHGWTNKDRQNKTFQLANAEGSFIVVFDKPFDIQDFGCLSPGSVRLNTPKGEVALDFSYTTFDQDELSSYEVRVSFYTLDKEYLFSESTLGSWDDFSPEGTTISEIWLEVEPDFEEGKEPNILFFRDIELSFGDENAEYTLKKFGGLN